MFVGLERWKLLTTDPENWALIVRGKRQYGGYSIRGEEHIRKFIEQVKAIEKKLDRAATRTPTAASGES